MQKKSDRRNTEAAVSNDRRSGRDRRQNKRIAASWPVSYGDKDTYLFSYISDISSMGIFVQTAQPKPLGTQLTVQFTPPGQKALELKGHVAWINPSTPERDPARQPGMGIQFIEVTDQQKQQLQNIVQTLALIDDELIETYQQNA